jgi:o-succinylbenzoate synthase
MLKACFQYFPLKFKKPAGTSRGILFEKPSWIISITDSEKNITGLGECSIIPGLSIDPFAEIEPFLVELCREINLSGQIPTSNPEVKRFPAIQFALETAFLDLQGGGKKVLFDNMFSRGKKGIKINGLIWMSDPQEMFVQAREKVNSGFKCLKFKIGALDFNTEIQLLKRVRKEFGQDIEIRLDANGAFMPSEAIQKLQILSEIGIHSIEQPIKPGQPEEMAVICFKSPIPIALDEELIGISGKTVKSELLERLKPQFIILKPSLTGGFSQTDEWTQLCESKGIGWWATSALESNIGLNAIAQWVADKNPDLPQGLGTGSLYVKNYPVPLEIKSGELWFIPLG